MSYAIAVDIGGTFTDLVAFDHETQKVLYAKSPTTYDNLVEGILDCFNKAHLKPAQASIVNHGTTLVITLIQRSIRPPGHHPRLRDIGDRPRQSA
jgi:N-methylhydantoinase A